MTRAVAAALALVLLTATPATGAKPRRASLVLASISPLIVSGRSFGAGESVVLTYAGADGVSRRVRVSATRQGGFRGFFRLRLDRCDSFTVRAAGAKGSRAVLQVERSCKQAKPPPPPPPPKPPPKGPKKPGSG